MQTRVHQSFRGGAAWIELRADDPAKPATLDLRVLDELAEAIERASSSDVRAVIVSSPGSKYFVVGANIKALQTLDRGTMDEWVSRGHEVFGRLERLPLLTIAAVDGVALGGGLELALACDVIVATETSRFGLPEATLGLIPGWGGTRRLTARVGRGTAMRMMLTGHALNAVDARSAGLIDLLVPDAAALDAAVAEMVSGAATTSTTAARLIKQIMTTPESSDSIESCCDCERALSRDAIADPETRKRLDAFFEQRARRASAGKT